MKNAPGKIPVTDALLSKYFCGEAAPAEAMAIDDWINESEENKKQFLALFKAWSAMSPNPYQVANLAGQWQQVRSAIQEKPAASIAWLKWSIAAALLVSTCIAATWWFLRQNTPAYQVAASGIGKTTSLVLPDSSTIVLNTGSTVHYPAVFNQEQRHVTLQGEAYFRIRHGASHPFIAETGPVRIKVLGTVFNVLNTDTLITTQVYEGKVMMYNDSGQIIVKSGQTGFYDIRSKQFSLLDTADRNNAAYATFRFYFDNEQLETVAAYLSKAYHKKIIIKDPALRSLRISSIFEDKPLHYILEVITGTLNIRFTYGAQDEIYLDET